MEEMEENKIIAVDHYADDVEVTPDKQPRRVEDMLLNLSLIHI